MSLKAMIWVRESAPTRTATEIVVLYSLADRANDDGTGAWPSRATLADEARCSRATINRVLRDLEDRQVIVRGDQTILDRHNYPRDRRPVVWDLNMSLDRADEETGSQIETPPAEEETGSRRRADGVSPTTQRGIADEPTGYRRRDLNPPQTLPDPSSNQSPLADAAGDGPATVAETPVWETPPLIERPSLDPETPVEAPAPVDAPPASETAPRPGEGRVPDEVTPEFLDWYRRYPVSKGRKDGFKAWWKAVRQISVEDLNAATDRYAAWVEAGGVSDKQFVPYPATWLNGERWDDELPDPRPASRPSNSLADWLSPEDLAELNGETSDPPRTDYSTAPYIDGDL